MRSRNWTSWSLGTPQRTGKQLAEGETKDTRLTSSSACDTKTLIWSSREALFNLSKQWDTNSNSKGCKITSREINSSSKGMHRINKIGLILCHSHIKLRLRFRLSWDWYWGLRLIWGCHWNEVEMRSSRSLVEIELRLSWELGLR